ncbi:MAG: 2-hydroxyglutaryl-CoA dehydratase, partial [Lachnospiraceae bacterium]|nr:2-hydroxyglutaryl-CoA dehydratase [Lachnospiraceae bacterium]
MDNKGKLYRLGVDIGSTTVKIAIINEKNEMLFSDYKRHFANIQETLTELLEEGRDALKEKGIEDVTLSPTITGSGGLTLSKHLQIPFVQEVVAVATSLKDFAPHCDVAIELGGEDAKIIYFSKGGGIDQRMNGICAGGTGSFIDQMASLLQTDAAGLNKYAESYKAIYPIAARCGVFAKTDIQPLINDGATREDLAASIFQAVVNQTISGLACGKPIRGNIAFLGGPLHFLPELRNAFIRTLNLTGDAIIAPEHSHLFAALGSAMNSDLSSTVSMDELIERLSHGIKMEFEIKRLEPLFKDQDSYDRFRARHEGATVKKEYLANYHGNAYLGIDAGSTTTKIALVSE